jgi:predicted nucleic acid-binding protein
MSWRLSVPSDLVYLSVLSVGEIRRGIELLRPRDRVQARALEQWLGRMRRDFAERILDVTAPVAERWGEITARATLPAVDGLLAATALEHDLTLVTRDTRPLAATGARVLDPWQE